MDVDMPWRIATSLQLAGSYFSAGDGFSLMVKVDWIAADASYCFQSREIFSHDSILDRVRVKPHRLFLTPRTEHNNQPPLLLCIVPLLVSQHMRCHLKLCFAAMFPAMRYSNHTVRYGTLGWLGGSVSFSDEARLK